jgi:C4-dicarboxylate-specific signal transduction histidine kinase
VRGEDGAYRWFLSRAEPLRSSDGTLLYWIGVNLDIDDAMQAEETLTRVKERLALATEAATGAQLSAAIAHEIVQPLSALVANARAALHWLEGDAIDAKRAGSLIEIVLRDGMSIGNVMHVIRERFKAQSPNKTIVQPNELVQQVALVVGKDLCGKGIELLLDLDPHLPEMALDAIQIQQVLLNLVRNASGAFNSQSEVPRVVTIRTRTNQRLTIEVEENGSYLPDPEKVFETFYSSDQGGLGIGLAISRSIALSHGGTLVAERRDPSGVRFSLNLPLWQSAD